MHPEPANSAIPPRDACSSPFPGAIPDRWGRILTVGLGTAVVMWWVGYLTHLRVVRDTLSGPVVFGAFLVCLVPGLNLLAMPVLVAGGTLLALRYQPEPEGASPPR